MHSFMMQVAMAPAQASAQCALRSFLGGQCAGTSVLEATVGSPAACRGSRRPRRAGGLLAASVVPLCATAAALRVRRRRRHRASPSARGGRLAVRGAARAAEGGAPWNGSVEGAAPSATYVKVWIGKVQWAGENGAVLNLEQVYGASSSQELPCNLHLPLDATEADDFQKALFGKLAPAIGGDDALCDVRVHGRPEPFAELVMNAEGCPFPPDGAPEGGQFSIADIHDLGVQRHRCGVGEALGTAQRLEVPALVCTSYLLHATRACLNRAMLEQAVQGGARERPPARGHEDPSLRALEEQLHGVLSCGPAAGVRRWPMGSTLRAASAFARYWALHQGRLGDFSPQPFAEFCAQFLRPAGAAEVEALHREC